MIGAFTSGGSTRASAVISSAKSPWSGMFPGIASAPHVAGQEAKFSLVNLGAMTIKGIQVTRCESIGGGATVLRVSDAPVGGVETAGFDITIANGATNAARVSGTINLPAGSPFYVYEKTANGYHADIQYVVDGESA